MRVIVLSIPLVFVVGTLLVLGEPTRTEQLARRAKMQADPPSVAETVTAASAPSMIASTDVRVVTANAPDPAAPANIVYPVQTAMRTDDKFARPNTHTDHAARIDQASVGQFKRTPLPITPTPPDRIAPQVPEEQPVPDPKSLDPFGDLKPNHGEANGPGFRFFDSADRSTLKQDSPGIILGQIERHSTAEESSDDSTLRFEPTDQSQSRAGGYVVKFGALKDRSLDRTRDRSNYYPATLSNRMPPHEAPTNHSSGTSMANSSGASNPRDADFDRIAAQITGLNRQVELVAQVQRQQMQSEQLKYLKDLHEQLEALKQRATKAVDAARPDGTGAAPTQPANGNSSSGTPKPNDVTGSQGTPTPTPTREPVMKVELSTQAGNVSSDEERFSLQIEKGTEIIKVLEMLGQLSGKNVLVSAGVSGEVSANLQNVTVDEALDALLKVRNFSYQKNANFIFVTTLEEEEAKKQAARKVISKVYRPNYISAKELQSLITPLLTKNIGISAVTNPAEAGIASDPSTAGGDTMSQQDALLIQDYDSIIAQVDQIVDEMDVPPAQVVIEALILQVKLSDTMAMGVNFALLGDNNKNFSVVGDGNAFNGGVGFPQNVNAVQDVGKFLGSAGLKYGFIQGDVSAFIEALETITDVNLVAAPTIRVLNKQKAQLIIGQKLPYTETTTNGATTQTNVNFLEVGTKLFVRPFVAPDGYVRMEVHPELSDGTIQNGLPNTTTAEVTTNVMIQDGATIVLGGLIRESVTESTSGVPWLSSLPGVGGIFRNKSDSVLREELIVLLTPRIVNQAHSAARGEEVRDEQFARAREFKHSMTPASRVQMARTHYDSAQQAFERDDQVRAVYHIKQAARLSPNNLEVLRLKRLIESQIPPRSWFPSTNPSPDEVFHSPPAPRRTGRVVPPSPSPSRRTSVARRPALQSTQFR